MIALCLDDNGRIAYTSIVLPNGIYTGMPIVDALPPGDCTDYLYINDEFVYAPVDRRPVADRNINVGEYITVYGVLHKVIDSIPCGEKIIPGQNVTETTIEEQLAELAKGE